MMGKINVVLVDFWLDEANSLVGPCLRNWVDKDAELSNRIGIHVMDFSLDRAGDNVAVDILKRAPDLVGLSCYMWSLDKILKVVREIKERRPATRIILGGPEVEPIPDRILQEHRSVDWVACAEEGEEVFRQLLRYLAFEESDLSNVPGLAYRESDGGIHRNACPPLIDLESAPLVYANELRPTIPRPEIARLELSRGCPFACKFCNWTGSKGLRQVSMSKVACEFKALSEKVMTVCVIDSNILLSQRRGSAILRTFVETTRESPSALHFNTNPCFLIPDIVDIMAEVPRKFHVALGVQTINPKALKMIGRVMDVPLANANLAYLKSRAPQLPAIIHLIFGLPGDDLDGFRRSLDWAFCTMQDGVTAFPLSVLPGSAICREAKNLGLHHESIPPYHILETLTMDREDIERAHELAIYAGLFPRMPQCFDSVFAGVARGDDLGYVTRLEEWIAFLKGLDLAIPLEQAPHDHQLAWQRLKQDRLFTASLAYAANNFRGRHPQTSRALIK
jgi:tRNA A37 methylthiotransferase MiaB